MPKLIDHGAREVAVAEAAWRVLERQGVRGVSVRTVAAEAGLAVGSLRRSFPTQARLLASCIQLVDDRASARLQAIPRGDDVVCYCVDILCELLPLDDQRRMEAQVWLALSLEALADPDLRAACDEVDASIRRVVGGLLDLLAATGSWHPVDSRLTIEQEAARLYALLDGLALHLVRQPDGAPTSWARDVLAQHLHGLTSGPR